MATITETITPEQWKEFLESAKQIVENAINYHEVEKELIAIRKYQYISMKREVKRGLRSSVDLVEFELWKW